ncbi:hypothetical protein [Plantibacter sp. YIM 135249]|uniref:hypothetical protein n=1 Tax=Plantibacter sp. YIM 135249 TaxID=3423918 RepID=UPI003D325959
MARIRTIKPEFWDSPGTAAASLRGRLFFIALWNWADDWGVGTGNPKQLIGFAFPNDDDVTAADFPRLRTEVADCYGVVWYDVDSRPYYAIPSWDQHQKNERRANRRNPTPDQGIIADTETRGSSVHERGTSAPGTEEQGNRGTGEQRNRGTDTPAPSALTNAFETAWPHWPKKVERKPALEKFKVAARKFPDVSELVAVVIRFGDAYAATTETRFVPALGVWLSKERWTDELPQRQQERSNLDGHAELWATYAQPSPQMEIEQ